jgi:DNA-binding MarR family transcriptional regulator
MSAIEPDGTPVSIGVLMLVAYRHMEQRILAAVVEAGHDITLAQARVFQRLDPGGSRLTRLAQASQVTKQAAGFLVDELARGGYVERVPDPADGRARLVRITDRGREVVAVALVEQRRIEEEWRAHLGSRRFTELHRSLERLREITDPWQ